jgi:hypothetical protein
MKIDETSAKKLAIKNNLPRAEKYDLIVREYDGMIELVGYVNDPTIDVNDFINRESLIPKRWLTLGVFNPNTFELEV